MQVKPLSLSDDTSVDFFAVIVPLLPKGLSVILVTGRIMSFEKSQPKPLAYFLKFSKSGNNSFVQVKNLFLQSLNRRSGLNVLSSSVVNDSPLKNVASLKNIFGSVL